MKILVLMFLFMMLATLSAGCLIRTNSRGGGYRSCPPAHHWDGYACVHNGNGRGNGPKVRDHRR
jgi:hypothetical protein